MPGSRQKDVGTHEPFSIPAWFTRQLMVRLPMPNIDPISFCHQSHSSGCSQCNISIDFLLDGYNLG